jgi:hypothetical protein
MQLFDSKEVLEERTDGWLNVRAFGKTGWVHLEDVQTADGFLKIFFVDVGQGDGCLIEAPGKRLLVDAGQYARNMRNFLTKFKYKWLNRKDYPFKVWVLWVAIREANDR